MLLWLVSYYSIADKLLITPLCHFPSNCTFGIVYFYHNVVSIYLSLTTLCLKWISVLELFREVWFLQVWNKYRPWPTGPATADWWIFFHINASVLLLPGSGGSLQAWNHLGSIHTNRRCACTGTCSPVYGSSWWCAGCYPPCSHSGRCSPAPCGRMTIDEQKKRRR